MADRCEFCGLPQPWSDDRRFVPGKRQARLWRPEDESLRWPAVEVAAVDDRSRLLVIDGDVTSFAVDALVSNDDVDGRMWTSVASSIKAVAGDLVERASVAGGPYPLNTAWFTTAGELNIGGIVHVAVVDRNGRSNGLQTIQDSVVAALGTAVEKKVKSIALAAIGTPAISVETWLKAVPIVILQALRDNQDARLDVLLVLYDPEDFEALVRQMHRTIGRWLKDADGLRRWWRAFR